MDILKLASAALITLSFTQPMIADEVKKPAVWRPAAHHMEEMVHSGIDQAQAAAVERAAYAKVTYELCGEHFFPKSLADETYTEAMESGLPSSVVKNHIAIMENLMKEQLPDEKSVISYCSK